jgi:hypothetical protein
VTTVIRSIVMVRRRRMLLRHISTVNVWTGNHSMTQLVTLIPSAIAASGSSFVASL